MKNLFFISCLFFVPFFAFAQSLLDSMYYGFDSRHHTTNIRYYQYDNQGRIVETISRNKDLPITFQNRIRFEYLDNQTIETKAKWLITAQRWENETQTIEEFNDGNSTTKKTFLNWNTTTNQFEIEWFSTYEYDDNNKLIEYKYNWWNSSISQFVQGTRTYEYDNRGNLVREAVENSLEFLWQYNEQNLLIEYQKYRWNDSLNSLELTITETNDYDDKNRLIRYIHQSENSYFNGLYYTYANKNRLNTEQRIVIFESDTLYDAFTTYFYDAQTNQLSKTITGEYETLYSYDNFGNLSEVKVNHPYVIRHDGILEFYKYNDDNILIEKFVDKGGFATHEYFGYDENGELKSYDKSYQEIMCGVSDYQYNETYFRSNHSNTAPDKPTINCLFPNPYTNFQQITCDELAPEKIYDLMVVNIAGQTVYETKFSGRNGFFINRQLDKGWYVFVILEKGEIVTKQKILVF